MKIPDYTNNGEVEKIRNRSVQWSICCDCGLSHFVYTKIIKKEAHERWWRDDWDTQKQRKKLPEETIKRTIKLLQKELRRRKK